MKLNLGRYSEGWVKILNFKFSGDADVLLMLSQDSEDEIRDLCLNLQYDFGKMNSTLGSVVPLAIFCMRIPIKQLIFGMFD